MNIFYELAWKRIEGAEEKLKERNSKPDQEKYQFIMGDKAPIKRTQIGNKLYKINSCSL